MEGQKSCFIPVFNAAGSVLLIEDPESTDMYRTLNVRQPKLVKDYNAYTGGVDKSDQLINKYNTLRKTNGGKLSFTTFLILHV